MGRLACPTDAGYAAYVDKVLRWERAPSPEAQARALFFTVRDGTAATTIGHRALVSPSLERCRERQQQGAFPAREIHEIGYDGPEEARDAFLDRIARPDPTMLFTMSHGLGAPRGGWRSTDEQRAIQGAISLGSGMRITAEDVATRPFLPGGIWFFLACYGGGTPGASAYHHWLTRLRAASGFGGRVDAVLAGLPKPGDKPFIAALPQAALSNPEGPLALMAHIDLAWTYSFQDMDAGARNRPSRFQGIFRALVDGARAGTSYQQLLRFLGETSVELSTMYDEEARRETAGAAVNKDAARAKQKANLWMLRQDLAGYVLLGDPAARLPLNRAAAAQKRAPRPAEVRGGSEAAAATSLLGFAPQEVGQAAAQTGSRSGRHGKGRALGVPRRGDGQGDREVPWDRGLGAAALGGCLPRSRARGAGPVELIHPFSRPGPLGRIVVRSGGAAGNPMQRQLPEGLPTKLTACESFLRASA